MMRIHCMGVGGVGVSGVAALLAAKGNAVSGCDPGISESVRIWLGARGVKVFGEHSPRHIAETAPDLIIRTPAVPDNHPELFSAKSSGIDIVRRGEVLARLVAEENGIAVCGSHGKTSTSCFTVALLRGLGIADTGWCIGGSTSAMGGVASPPGPGKPFVVEADESDGTLALYKPQVTVVTTIDADHMDHFATFADLEECFGAACASTSRRVVYCVENQAAAETALKYSVSEPLGYGFAASASLQARNVVCTASGSSFEVYLDGRRIGSASIGVPGRHNVLNALGAAGGCISLGYRPEAVVEAMCGIVELPARRFELHSMRPGIDVISDYSHHPAEIKALVETAHMDLRGRLVAVFQPHRYTRTRNLIDEFPTAFRNVDELILLPVYAASEHPLPGGRIEDLYKSFREANAADASIPVPKLANSVLDVAEYLSSQAAALQPGDKVLVVGAGNVVSLVGMLESRVAAGPSAVSRESMCVSPAKAFGQDESGRPRVSYGLPVNADGFEIVRDESRLSEILASGDGEVRVFGRGTNLLASDLGVRGVVVRLGMDAVKLLPDGLSVEAGCGISGPAFLARLRDEGLSGLEFMAGIPGSIGGWLAMNAGTRFGAIGDRVVSVVSYDKSGSRVVTSRHGCGFSYRKCEFLQDKIAVSAVFSFVRDTPEAIARRMDEFKSKRFDFSGLRTAGSVFKNPEGTSAGKLLDEAGCKGLRVGGAYVSERHANIIAAEDGATASDVIALVGIMKAKVFDVFGIELETEVKQW